MKKILLIFSFLILIQKVNANRYYVTVQGAGNLSGSSWSNAASGNMLYGLLFTSNPLDTFWISKGTYYTKQSPYSNSSDYKLSFTIPWGVSLYGGFIGNETSIDQRNISANPTILSGDIGADGNLLNNSRHTLLIRRKDRYPVERYTVIDGLIIQDGYADESVISSQDPNFNGICTNSVFGTGGGMLIYTTGYDTSYTSNNYAIYAPSFTNLKVKNCVFRNNYSRYNSGGYNQMGGGAVALFAVMRNHTKANFDNCIFSKDSVINFGNGSAICVTATDPLLLTCSNNITPDSTYGELELNLNNCSIDSCGGRSISGNNYSGGAIYVDNRYDLNSYGLNIKTDAHVKLSINNSRFIGNSGYSYGALAFGQSNKKCTLDTLKITNTRFTRNTGEIVSCIRIDGSDGDTTTLSNIILYNNVFENNAGQNNYGLFSVPSQTHGTAFKTLIKKCVFRNNIANGNATAILYWQQAVSSNRQLGRISGLIIDSCRFNNNINTVGRLIDLRYANSADSISITNSLFSNNTTSSSLLYITDNSYFNFPVSIKNTVFDTNQITTLNPVIYFTPSGLNPSLKIENVKMRNNTGSALLVDYNAISQDIPLNINNSEFIQNSTTVNGGAIHIIGNGPYKLKTNINRCRFIGNSANSGGAIAYEMQNGNNSIMELNMTNCLISGNSANAEGGGLLLGNSFGSNIFSANIVNTTIADNLCYDANGSGGIKSYGSRRLKLINSILYGNRINVSGTYFPSQYKYQGFANSGDTAIYSMFETDPNVNYSTLNNMNLGNSVFKNPLFVNPISATNAPNISGDYHLQTCSPAVNSGNNIYVNSNSDLEGNSRIRQSTVDLGAYESGYNSAITPIITQNGTILTSNINNGNQWYFNNTLIPNAISNTYTATQTGVYYCISTNANNCASDTSNNIFIDISTTINDFYSSQLHLYPNPSRDRVQIISSQIIGYLTVSNSLSEIIKTENILQKSTVIDIENWQPGLYFIIVSGKSYKLIKQ